MKNISKLTEKVRKLQKERDFERSRTLADYNSSLGFYDLYSDNLYYGTDGLGKIILDQLDKKPEVVWVDLGCGNGVALREGKMLLEGKGLDPVRLRTYGVDVLPFSEEEMQHYIRKFPEEYSDSMMKPQYAPVFIQDDIHTVSFSEKPDLITASYVLAWTDDPVKILANALTQANSGAYLFANDGQCIHFSDKPDSCVYNHSVFEEMMVRDGGKTIKRFHSPWPFNHLMIGKVAENSDFTYGLRLFRKNIRKAFDSWKRRLVPSCFGYMYGDKDYEAKK